MVLVVLTATVIWQRANYRQASQQANDLIQSMEALNKENLSLRAAADSLKTQNQSLADRLTAIEMARGPSRGDSTGSRQAVQDTAGVITLDDSGGAVTVLGARDIIRVVVDVGARTAYMGEVSGNESATPHLDALRGDATRSALRAGQQTDAPLPTPVSPVLTAIRSATPTLQWTPVASAREYVVSVAGEDGTVVWQANTGTQTRVAVPPATLQRGRVYFWQAEASVAGQTRLSPAVGFWLVDDETLRAIEAIEKTHEGSALIRASAYAAYGLYDEALAQVERLRAINPDNRSLETMRTNSRRRLGQQ